jgi:ferredoxin
MSRPVRLLVDWVACEAHGLCAELVPELITLDDWGYPVVADGDVPARLLPLARRAARACPTLALILESGPAAERARHRGTRSRARGA